MNPAFIAGRSATTVAPTTSTPTKTERARSRRAAAAAAGEVEGPVARGTPEDRDIRFDMDDSFLWQTAGLSASVM
jgi:hypothetical protein